MSINVGTGLVRNGLILHLNSSASENYSLSKVEVLVVAGGGGGGAYAAGAGGGGGGVVYSSSYPITPGSAISITVGNGGNGGTYSPYANAQNGQNSIFGFLSAIGGGAGGQGWGGNVGATGGCGGGGAGYDGSSGTYTVTGGSGTLGQGFAGGFGRGISGNRGAGGGGGGAGGLGGNSTTLSAGNGGKGLPFYISGLLSYYSGGGGGGDYGSDNGGIGGIGGGGRRSGGNSSSQLAGNGKVNTGGGGGGSKSATSDSWNGGNGGSGIVIVRYPGTQKATGGTITTVNGYTIHTFTTSGTFTPQSTQTFYGITDLGPNGRDFQIIGSPTYSSTVPENFTFNGNGQAWTLQNLTAAAPELTSETFLSKDNTKEIWFNLSTLSSTGEDASETAQALLIWPGYHSGIIHVPSGFTFYLWNNGVTSVYNHSFNITLSTNSWYQVVHTMDYGTSSGRWYINGVLQNTTNTLPSSFVLSSGPGTQNRINIGLANATSVPNSYRWKLNNGKISSVRLYNRSLSATEIQQNFNALRGRFGI
jgi:hypothetical protein